MSSTNVKKSRVRRRKPTSEGSELTVQALSEHTGVSVRNIRAYQTAGLLAPPKLDGRLALYDQEHVGKLALIRDLREQGFKLEAIKRMLDHTPQGAWPQYALISQLFSRSFFTVETPEKKSLADMARHWQAPATRAQQIRLQENGLYRPVGEGDVEILSPALERIGIQLAEMHVPLDTVLDLQDVLIKHTRAIARAYIQQLFLTWVTEASQRAPDTDASARLRSLFERLRPLAMGSVSAAFPVVLQQEFDRAVLDK